MSAPAPTTTPPEVTVTELIVDMTCGNCQRRVTEALTPVAGVERVEVQLAEKRV
jgi:copper chaperone CopZ